MEVRIECRTICEILAKGERVINQSESLPGVAGQDEVEAEEDNKVRFPMRYLDDHCGAFKRNSH